MENKMYNPDNNPAFNPDYHEPMGYPQGQGYPQPAVQSHAGNPATGYPNYPIAGQPMQQPPYYGNMSYPSNPPPQAMVPPPYTPTVGYQPAPNVGYQPAPTQPLGANTNIEASNFGASFSDKNIRRLFIRKVYLILLLQLLVTFGVVALFVFEKNVKLFVQRNMGIYIASYVCFLVTYIVLICCKNVRRRFPGNVIMLGLFTLSLAYMTGTISSMYDTNVVLLAAGICAGVCLGISLLSMWTKFDFTGCGGFLCVASLVIFFFGIACIFTYNYIMNTVYAALFGLLMMMFLAYDTQMIMGGRRHEASPEEYIFASLCLYLDIVYIFIIFLSLFGGKGN